MTRLDEEDTMCGVHYQGIKANTNTTTTSATTNIVENKHKDGADNLADDCRTMQSRVWKMENGKRAAACAACRKAEENYRMQIAAIERRRYKTKNTS